MLLQMDGIVLYIVDMVRVRFLLLLYMCISSREHCCDICFIKVVVIVAVGVAAVILKKNMVVSDDGFSWYTIMSTIKCKYRLI